MKTYRCESCGGDFDSEAPQEVTHPDDLKLLGVSAEDAAKFKIYVCPDCLKVPEEPEGEPKPGETIDVSRAVSFIRDNPELFPNFGDFIKGNRGDEGGVGIKDALAYALLVLIMTLAAYCLRP